MVKKEVVVFDKRFHQPCEWWEIRRRRWPNLLREQIFACHIDHDKVHTIHDAAVACYVRVVVLRQQSSNLAVAVKLPGVK